VPGLLIAIWIEPGRFELQPPKTEIYQQKRANWATKPMKWWVDQWVCGFSRKRRAQRTCQLNDQKGKFSQSACSNVSPDPRDIQNWTASCVGMNQYGPWVEENFSPLQSFRSSTDYPTSSEFYHPCFNRIFWSWLLIPSPAIKHPHSMVTKMCKSQQKAVVSGVYFTGGWNSSVLW